MRYTEVRWDDAQISKTAEISFFHTVTSTHKFLMQHEIKAINNATQEINLKNI
jgi:hypothetical protein